MANLHINDSTEIGTTGVQLSQLAGVYRSNIDVNTLTETGIYYCTSSVTNAPVSSYFMVSTLAVGGGDLVQFGFDVGGQKMYYRTKTPSWQPWRLIEYDTITNQTTNSWSVTKFGDGTAICRRNYDATVPSVTNAWGNVYSSGFIRLPDYPITFTDTPTTTVSWQRVSGSFNGWLSPHEEAMPSTTNPGAYQFTRPTSVSSSFPIRICIIAIGKWK